MKKLLVLSLLCAGSLCYAGSQEDLKKAAINGSLVEAEILVENGADISAPDGDGLTPFEYAAGSGHLALVRFFVEKGAPLSNSETGGTVLMRACVGGHLELAKYLIEQGSDVNARAMDGTSALMHAAGHGIPLAKLLVDRGAEINAINKDGSSVLNWANNKRSAAFLRILGAKRGSELSNMFITAMTGDDYAAIKALAALGLNLNSEYDFDGEEGETPLRVAVFWGNEKLVRLLLDLGADPAQNNPLFVASYAGRDKIARVLVSRGAPLRNPETGWTALMSACSGGHIELAKYFIEQGVDINAQDEDGESALMYASINDGDGDDLAKLLIANGAVPSLRDNSGDSAWNWAQRSGNETAASYLQQFEKKTAPSQTPRAAEEGSAQAPIVDAIVRDDAKKIKSLVKRGASLTAEYPYNDTTGTPLELAAGLGRMEAAKALVAAGADPAAGFPVFSAAYKGHLAMVEFLVGKGAVISNSETGWTALMSAGSGGHFEVSQYLLARRIDVNAQDTDGQTALMYAAEKSLPLVQLLVESGADVALKENSGLRALDWALREFKTEISDYLEPLTQGFVIFVREGSLERVRAAEPTVDELNEIYHYHTAEGECHILSPLEIAAVRNDLPMAKLLVEMGADPHYGYPVLRAVEAGSEEICEYLIGLGAAMVDARNGATALMYAAIGGNEAMVKLLLKSSNVNASDDNNRTALMMAVGHGVDFVKLFINAGADVSLEDYDGETAIDYANAERNTEVADYLKSLAAAKKSAS